MFKKRNVVWVLAALFVGLFAVTSFAASNILVRVYLYDNYEEGTILQPTIHLSSGTVEDVSWSKDTDQWKPGKKVTLTLTVSGDEYASKSYKSQCRVDGGSLVSARGKDGNLVITIEYYPVVKLGTPEEAGWSGTKSYVAVWKKVDYATGYKVKLYCNGEHVRTIRTTSSSLDLSSYINPNDTYYYEVCAAAGDTDSKNYIKEGDYIVSENMVLNVEEIGEINGKWRNYREGKKYELENGEYVTGWQKISGDWYCFDENGIMQTGWQPLDGKWYYMQESGTMRTGTLNLEEGTYFLGSDGAMQTGWIAAGPAKWYYAAEDGKMVAGRWEKISETWYYFYEDSTMAFNTTIDGYTLDANGVIIQQ